MVVLKQQQHCTLVSSVKVHNWNCSENIFFYYAAHLLCVDVDLRWMSIYLNFCIIIITMSRSLKNSEHKHSNLSFQTGYICCYASILRIPPTECMFKQVFSISVFYIKQTHISIMFWGFGSGTPVTEVTENLSKHINRIMFTNCQCLLFCYLRCYSIYNCIGRWLWVIEQLFRIAT